MASIEANLHAQLRDLRGEVTKRTEELTHLESTLRAKQASGVEMREKIRIAGNLRNQREEELWVSVVFWIHIYRFLRNCLGLQKHSEYPRHPKPPKLHENVNAIISLKRALQGNMIGCCKCTSSIPC